MRFAIFLDYINFEHLNKNVKQVYLFDLIDETIIAVGDELLFLGNKNYVLLWLLSKKVTFIFVDGLEDSIQELFRQAGIEVKELEAIKGNPLLETILFKHIKKGYSSKK